MVNFNLRKRFIPAIMIFMLLASLGLSACNGGAVIDFSYDPDQGIGNVVVNPGSQQGGDLNNTQVLLFAMALILLLAMLIIVVALARRPRDY